MLEAIYRKYRPQIFKELVGQNPIKVTLENEVTNDRIFHAYLFAGPRGIGKTTMARLLAKAINCPDRKKSEPCNKCDFCQEISQGRSMDLIEIDAASHTGVDNVRENIIENARFTPQKAKYKIFIIDEVHMLSLSAFNALLKTLEEPPAHVIFILATTEIHRVPETIISRCQRFDFKKVNIKDLVDRLQFIIQQEKVKIETKILETIARRADGSVRDAEVLLAQLLSLNKEDITEEEAALVIPRSDIGLVIELFGCLVRKDTASSLALVNRLVEEGVNVQEFTRNLIEFLRKLILIKISKSLDEFSSLELDQEQTKNVLSDLELVKTRDLIRIIESFIKHLREIKFSYIPQLPLEMAILAICESGVASEEVENFSVKSQEVSGNPLEKKNGPKKDKESQSIKQGKKIKDNSSVTLQGIETEWSQVLANLRQYNHSLALVLKAGVPVELKDNILVVGFRFKFHADRLRERKVFTKVEEVLESMFNGKIKVKARILEKDEWEKVTGKPKPESKTADVLSQINNAFGSDIVAE